MNKAEEGYRGKALEFLKRYGVEVGDLISICSIDGELEGTLIPRYAYADDEHIVIKLKNGYNLGVRIDKIKNIIRRAKGEKPRFTKAPLPKFDPNLPLISIISTGGTIASRIDYRTGAVYPALSAEDLYSVVPEIGNYANVDAEILMSLYSENITPKDWGLMAKKIHEKIQKGVKAVIITHGTDTLGYTAAALSFALRGLPIPVILVGAQRSSDRPSSDAATNLIGATILGTRGNLKGVFVVMHDGLSDDRLAVHIGTKVRKNHTSRRDAFESVNIAPIAYIEKENIVQNYSVDEKEGLIIRPDFEEKVALIKFYPNMNPKIIDFFIDEGYRGIVLEGTGLGHVSSRCYESLKRAIKEGLLVCMTSQCIWGRVRMTVYDTGRDLLSLGILPLEDMLPETAYVKLSWVLANSNSIEEAKELMLKNLAHEYTLTSSLEKRSKY
ncbi:MAG: Glu-tRNA(Gln) amidotransferase subunit GatD [Nitrososphaerales archaeon]